MATTHVLEGRTVDVKRAVPRDKSTPTPVLPPSKQPPAPAAAARGAGSISSNAPAGMLPGAESKGGRGAAGSGRGSRTAAAAQGSSSASAGSKPAGAAAAAVDSSMPEQARKIFVGGLAPAVTDSDFKAYFERFGSISDAVR